jgi:hypothetical protein
MGMVLGTPSDSGSLSASIQRHSTARNVNHSTLDGWKTINQESGFRSQESGRILPALLNPVSETKLSFLLIGTIARKESRPGRHLLIEARRVTHSSPPIVLGALELVLDPTVEFLLTSLRALSLAVLLAPGSWLLNS